MIRSHTGSESAAVATRATAAVALRAGGFLCTGALDTSCRAGYHDARRRAATGTIPGQRSRQREIPLAGCRAPARQRSSRRRRSRAAFTLIELLLVATVLVILAGIAAPRYASAMTQYRADAAARRLVSDISTARATARARSAGCTIEFSGVSYRVSGVRALDGPGEYRVNLGESPYNIQALSLDFGSATSLSFDGYGALSAGGTIIVRAGSARRKITIDAASGTARIGGAP
jgi:prepilin-type N-terminal cleavage/methylation domain-containing protein